MYSKKDLSERDICTKFITPPLARNLFELGCLYFDNVFSYTMIFGNWRTRKDEIDFVLEKKGKVIGLEVKSDATQKTPGMEAFKKQPTLAQVFSL